jgi:hypothetical protein
VLAAEGRSMLYVARDAEKLGVCSAQENVHE